MNKTAIKNFAIWARNKLIADIQYRAGLMGITADGIKDPLPQSTGTMEFYDIGTEKPYAITGEAIGQRRKLVEIIRQKENDSSYAAAYKYILEEVAYTWFNRLIAIRFMEVNDYLPSHIRVLSSESGKIEPDLVTTPFDAELPFTAAEEETVLRLKNENKLDELFRLLFIKQCNVLNEILPALFEKTSDYTELLLNLSVVDREGVVYRLTHDIPESDFDVSHPDENGEIQGQVEIVGWLYQYYNTELNEQVYDGTMSKSRIPKELLPAATTIYTPDWPARYMVENSLGRLWFEGHPNDELKSSWKYYLDEAEQEPEVETKLADIRKEYSAMTPEQIKVIDPCMGSGHILVYAFDVLMQIYESQGWSQRDAAQSILQHNLYGVDIDDRASQLAYFAVMMKARQYDRRIFSRGIQPHVYAIQESNSINRDQLKYFGWQLSELERNMADTQMRSLLDALHDAKEYGSIIPIEQYDWELLYHFVLSCDYSGQMDFDAIGLENLKDKLFYLVQLGATLAQKYDVVVTNPPYLGNSRFSPRLDQYVKEHYADVKSDLSMAMYRAAIDNFAKKNAFITFITTSSWMFLSSFEKLRVYLNHAVSIYNLVDFGTELFDGKVGHNPIVSWVTRNCSIDYKMTAIRLVDYCYSRRDEKEPEFFNMKNRYTAQQSNFSKIPGSPVTYSVGNNVFLAYDRGVLLGKISTISEGVKTGDNERFLRIWHEIESHKFTFGKTKNNKWIPHHKGGEFRKWYGNRDWVINWLNDGQEIKCSSNSGLQGKSMYFSPFASWSKISSKGNPLRYFEGNFLFDSGAPAIFNQELFMTMGLLNTKVGELFLSVLSPTLNLQVGDVKGLPLIIERKEEVEQFVTENIRISQSDWDSCETSWDFKRYPMVQLRMAGAYAWGDNPPVMHLSSIYNAWKLECDGRFQKLKANEEELNRIFIDIYGLQDELTPEVADKDITVHRVYDTKDDVPESMKGSGYVRTKRDEIVSLLSYAVGCMFGRYTLYEDGLFYAGGAWDYGSKVDCLSDSAQKNGFKEWNPSALFLPDEDNVLPITDEEYLEDDIVSRLCDWLKAVYGADALEENLDFIAGALGGKAGSSREVIRSYFLKDFFKDHCKTYQKRPIYWLFDSGKQNGFKALIYLHRYTPDTIGNLRVDYLHKMQRVYESEISRMQDMIDHSTNAREVATSTKRKEKLQKQLKECRDYDEKIAHLALSRIELDLDDGVKVNYRKLQTAVDGKFYEVLADSKNIMAKEK